MTKPINHYRVSNCMHTIVTSKTTCSCYSINSLNDTVEKVPCFEHKKVIHYEIDKVEEKHVFEVTLLFLKNESIKIKVPFSSETFSYGPLEFGFQWKEAEERKSISFSLDTEFLSWDEFNKRHI